jgi:hypothetical protein
MYPVPLCHTQSQPWYTLRTAPDGTRSMLVVRVVPLAAGTADGNPPVALICWLPLLPPLPPPLLPLPLPPLLPLPLLLLLLLLLLPPPPPPPPPALQAI